MKAEDVKVSVLVDGLNGINCWKCFAEKYPHIVDQVLDDEEDKEILLDTYHVNHLEICDMFIGVNFTHGGKEFVIHQNDSIFAISVDDLNKLTPEEQDKFWETFYA